MVNGQTHSRHRPRGYGAPTARGRILAVLLALSMSVAPAVAQFGFPFWQQERPPAPARPRPSAPPKPKPEVEAAPPVTSTPYDRDLQRLAEILGALHFLRGLCGSGEGEKWRQEAQALIDAETPAGQRRDLMVQSFNRGYAGFQQSYRTCTPAAGLVIRRYLEEGARIARDITSRYAN